MGSYRELLRPLQYRPVMAHRLKSNPSGRSMAGTQHLSHAPHFFSKAVSQHPPAAPISSALWPLFDAILIDHCVAVKTSRFAVPPVKGPNTREHTATCAKVLSACAPKAQKARACRTVPTTTYQGLLGSLCILILPCPPNPTWLIGSC